MQPGSPGQEPRGQVDRNAAERGPPELPHAEVEQAHERQGRQEVLAELAVSSPRQIAIDLERQGVDQDRLTLVELHVEGAAILERHPTKQRAALHVQRQKRGIAQALKLHSPGYEMNSTRSGRKTL